MLRELAQWEKWSPDYSNIWFYSDLCKVPHEHQRTPTQEDSAWVKRGSQRFKQKVQKLSRVVVHSGNLRHFSTTEIWNIWERNGWRWSGKPKGCLVLKVFTYQSFKFTLLVVASPWGMLEEWYTFWEGHLGFHIQADLSHRKITCDIMLRPLAWSCKEDEAVN